MIDGLEQVDKCAMIRVAGVLGHLAHLGVTRKLYSNNRMTHTANRIARAGIIAFAGGCRKTPVREWNHVISCLLTYVPGRWRRQRRTQQKG